MEGRLHGSWLGTYKLGNPQLSHQQKPLYVALAVWDNAPLDDETTSLADHLQRGTPFEDLLKDYTNNCKFFCGSIVRMAICYATFVIFSLSNRCSAT